MTKSIIFSGFGGQGILFAGKLIAYCGILEKKEVSWIPSYGPEMRGGTANCSVKISDSPISSPIISSVDCLVAMNLPSLNKFADKIKSGGMAIIDSTMIKEKYNKKGIQTFYVPATETAEKMKLKGMANIILCGKFLKESKIISHDIIKSALEKIIPKSRKHLIELNLKAIEIGMQF